MAKQHVVVCDLPRGIPAADMSGKPCDRLASGTCAVCGRDVCPDHIAFKLEARLVTTAPSKVAGQNPPDPILPCVDFVLASPICMECHKLIHEVKTRGGSNFGKTPIPKVDMNPHLAALLEAAFAELGAARATMTLTEDPPKGDRNA